MLRDIARSLFRVSEIIVTSDAQRQRTSDTTPALEQKRTMLSVARSGDADEATRATAIPEAVTIVLVMSVYIARVGSVV